MAPHVRLELINWQPLADPSLNSMAFIPTLFEEHPNPAMGDAQLIPQVVVVVVVVGVVTAAVANTTNLSYASS